MTDEEIQDIFAEELTGKPTEKALMVSQNRIAIEILEKSAKPFVNDGAWELLKDITYTKSRLGMFLGITSGSLVQVKKQQKVPRGTFCLAKASPLILKHLY